MALYSLNKWYFDFAAADGWHVLGYVASVQVLGFEDSRLYVAATRRETGERASGSCAIRLAPGYHQPERVDLCHGGLRLGPGGGRIALGGGSLQVDASLTLAANDCQARGLVIRQVRRAGAIHWLPLALRARATGRVSVGPQEISFADAPAYVDYLSSTILPPLVPASDLFWGRGQSPELSIAYRVLRGRRADQQWARLVICRNGRPESFDVELRGAAALAGVDGRSFASPELRVKTAKLTVMVHVEPVSLALATDFFGETEGLGELSRSLLRRVARAPRAVKYFARAHVRIDEAGAEPQRFQVPLFAEHVRFEDALPLVSP